MPRIGLPSEVTASVALLYQRHRPTAIEQQRRLAADRPIVRSHGFDRPIEPQPGDEPVVGLGIRPVRRHLIDFHAVFAEELMKILIVLEHQTKLGLFVGPPDLLSHKPADVADQSGLIAVVVGAIDQEGYSLLDPGVAHAVVVKLRGNVVGQVVRLEIPDLEKIWLEPNDLVDGQLDFVPVLNFLVVIGVAPQDVRGHAPQAERSQLHRFAGRVDLAQPGLGEVVLFAELGELSAARAQLRPALGTNRCGLAESGQRQQEQRNTGDVDDLANERLIATHAAISRVLRKK